MSRSSAFRAPARPRTRRVHPGRAAGTLVLLLLPLLLGPGPALAVPAVPALAVPAPAVPAPAVPAPAVPAPAVPAPAVPAPAAPAVGVWPLEPEPAVVARFDPPVTRYASGHRGVDLAGTAGQVVRSALPGRVVFAGRVAGRGVVVVGHGATRTTYEPVAASVPVGTEVGAGQPIGTLETFGGHCGLQACLHWGLLDGDRYLDPLTLVGAGPVRLLPLLLLPGRTTPGAQVSEHVADEASGKDAGRDAIQAASQVVGPLRPV